MTPTKEEAQRVIQDARVNRKSGSNFAFYFTSWLF
jgi:hypothetical protein